MVQRSYSWSPSSVRSTQDSGGFTKWHQRKETWILVPSIVDTIMWLLWAQFTSLPFENERLGLNNLYGLYGSQSVSVLGVGGRHRTCREVWSVSGSCLLSSRSLLSPDPKFPEEGPHSLFLQEGHLQALQVQEPAQLQEPPARKEKASGEQRGGGATKSSAEPLPIFLGQDQRWSSQSTQVDREAPAPLFWSQESRSPPDLLPREGPGSRPSPG